MATSMKDSRRIVPRLTNGAADALAYAASPIFALMALMAANDAARMTFCSAGSGTLAINGMAMMYLLMSAFHLRPWLKLAGAGSARTTLLNQGEDRS